VSNDAPVIVWFREDLRVTDQAALQAAVKSGRPIVPLFVLDEHTAGDWVTGGAQRWWLHHSLLALNEALTGLGAPLLLRRGRYHEVLTQIVAELGAGALYFSRGYEPWMPDLERSLHEDLGAAQVEVKRFSGRLLLEPGSVCTQGGDPYKVFTPFWRACLKQLPPRPPLPAPEALTGLQHDLRSDALTDWQLLPTAPDWSDGIAEQWTPGEDGAMAALERFLDDAVLDYATARDVPAERGTSRLSPYLHFGEISPRQVWQAVADRFDGDTQHEQAAAFLREIGWREFSHHLLAQWPGIADEPFKADFERFPWRENAQALDRWQRGQTGYPIVDAGMRELYATGWMHNRVRMIVASFLVKHLLLHWRHGEAWFWDTLVDADLANNAAGWQWVAGSGADAAPYFRIFNPTLQGKKFDGHGDYVRRWVPEIAALPDKHLHEPAKAPSRVLQDAGLTLGVDYPEPIVDHAMARQRALDALKQMTG
jgi:deoxyribodipyrimidine photo-lyase